MYHITGLESLIFKINLSLIVKHKTICSSKYKNIIRTIKEKTQLRQIEQKSVIENGTRHQRIYFNFVLNEDSAWQCLVSVGSEL